MTFRPPYEERSLLLQVTTGCSHNACAFCSMYQDVPFSVSPMEEVEEDIAYVARHRTLHKRVFLVNGDAFCLSTDRLVAIAELIHERLPRIESIGGYASINNILTKSADELLIQELEHGLLRFPSWQLDTVPNKAAEGRIIV